MCANLRRTYRALTQLYEQALRPLGLRATQLTVLQVLSRSGEVSQGQLGEMLAMDSTSLTRTLGIMRHQGWVAERRGDDRPFWKPTGGWHTSFGKATGKYSAMPRLRRGWGSVKMLRAIACGSGISARSINSHECY